MTINIPAGAPVECAWQRFKARLAQRINGWRFDYAVWCGYYGRNGEPLRCQACDRWHWADHKETILDRIDYSPCEVSIDCVCGHNMGYWAYGYWQPPYI